MAKTTLRGKGPILSWLIASGTKQGQLSPAPAARANETQTEP